MSSCLAPEVLASHIVKLIQHDTVKFFQEVNEENERAVLVLSPTGVAAYNIGGQTIHSALHFGPHSTDGAYKNASSDVLGTLRIELDKVRLIVIDEISMKSATMLYQIHMRLRQVSGLKDMFFGNKSILAVGDLYQLEPVAAPPVFGSPSRIPNSDLMQFNLWTDLFRIIELKQVMRQRNVDFAELLNRVRIGSHTDSDLEVSHFSV
jgi:hypothetical protein